jgi:hypothetical protein
MTDVDGVVYMPVAAIAHRDGVSRQAISKQVARLIEKHGLEVRRDHNGRVAGVNVVHFDKLMNRFGDSAQMRSKPQPPPEPESPAGDTLDAARIRKLALDTELQRLNLDEQRGLLVRHDVIGESIQRLGEELARTADLTQHADGIAAAFTRAGLHGLRIELKALTARLRTDMADRCAALTLMAPEIDPPLTPSHPAAERAPA